MGLKEAWIQAEVKINVNPETEHYFEASI